MDRSNVLTLAALSLTVTALLGSQAVFGQASPLPEMLKRMHGESTEPSPLQSAATWTVLDAEAMAAMMRASLDVAGIAPDAMTETVEQFLTAVQQDDAEPLTAWIVAISKSIPPVESLLAQTFKDPIAVARGLDPNQPLYATMESLPPEMRAGMRTLIGRELVRGRFYDEALPVFAEVDPALCPDPASLLFYRGACYHALLKTKESLADLRQLLTNEEKLPIRYSRTAQLLVADLKPLKPDSLDEISRMMTDVTRRLDLGRPGPETQQREQEIIDKLTKLIDKLEEQQQQQQQQQQQSSSQGGSPSNGQSSPMEDSQAAGASGQGDAERKAIADKDGWGNLPPAERQESLQQISRDLPTHYREAIEAYFRKLATQNEG